MKKIIFLSFVLLLTIACFSQQKEGVETVNKAYTSAVESGDTTALKNIFHEEMIITGPMGNQRGKKAEIADLVTPGIKTNFFRMENTVVRVFNNTAVTTGNLVWQINMNGNNRDFRMAFTFTYAMIGKDWKIVAQHIGRSMM